MMAAGSRRGSRPRSALAPAFVAALAIVGPACDGGGGGKPPNADAFLSARPFVAVFDGAPLGAAGPDGADGAKNFRLAIHKGELGKPWFLSAYLKQLFPGAVAGGAASSLGTRVVSFEAQNGKLFVFDVDRRKKTSDVFDPQVLVEAYPVVTDGAWAGLAGADDYVVFDPAAGLNRFDAAGAAFGAGGRDFETELSFLQGFRQLDDGVSFEQVFTGHLTPGTPRAPGDIEPNQFAYSGTMGVALRRYAEGEGFAPKPRGSRAYYFESEPRLSPNTGVLEASAVRWNLAPGKPPVRWRLQSTASEYALSPPASDYDLVGAIKAGVESWNAAFGFEALRFELGAPGESFADDDKNVILFDPDPTNPYAFADWRTNPNTGEIRGASVYFNAVWLLLGHLTLDGDPGAAPTLPTFPALSAPAPAPFAWGPLRSSHLCVLTPAALAADGPIPGALTPSALAAEGPLPGALTPAALAPAPAEPLTKKQKVERYVAHVIAHEIGHTLGLRHNFKGSLLPPSSSIMDYLVDAASVALPDPAAYDVDAVRFLYDLSPSEPAQPFCTDESLAGEALCARFDAGAAPLADALLPAYAAFLDDFLAGASGTLPNTSLNRVLAYVRAGDSSATKLAAWDGAFGPLRALAPGRDPGPLDAATGHVIFRLLLSPPEQRGDVATNPPFDPAMTPRLVDDLRATLLNQTGALSFATRRLAVDALEALQADVAYVALVGARAELAARLPSLAGDEAALTGELIARLDRAATPYFD
ncbi:MAG TPA: zinc-dependent metalloprotease [Polyangiaceae bacterium]|nr:zinc-dependent metalloprotease [Polyangiaceae bacterium]